MSECIKSVTMTACAYFFRREKRVYCVLLLAAIILSLVIAWHHTHLRDPTLFFCSGASADRCRRQAVNPLEMSAENLSALNDRMLNGQSMAPAYPTKTSTRQLESSVLAGKNFSNKSIRNFTGSEVRLEVHHLFFLKVHKAASSTLQNIISRFVLSRNLTVMLPKKGHLLSQSNKNWKSRAVPVPGNGTAFDVLCHHLVFNEKQVRSSLFPDAKFIGIVRNPFDQFVSAFQYYRQVFHTNYLANISGQNPISTYLSNPKAFEPADAGLSYTNNRMSFDFGIDPKIWHDRNKINNYIHYINRTFDLVLISERFDESVILMKRILNWSLRDVLYLKVNVLGETKPKINSTLRAAHRHFNPADYALYEHFSKVFQQTVAKQGAKFTSEMKTFQSVLKRLNSFCHQNRTSDLQVKATDWNEEFSVTRKDCEYMSLPEVALTEIIRSKQERKANQENKKTTKANQENKKTTKAKQENKKTTKANQENKKTTKAKQENKTTTKAKHENKTTTKAKHENK